VKTQQNCATPAKPAGPVRKPESAVLTAELAVHYQTIGVIQGMRNLPATFTPGKRLGPGLDETLDNLQRICDEQELARPITERKETAVIDWK
jgi:hypothetical protein